MTYKVEINMPIENHEVPDLREQVGCGRRDYEYRLVLNGVILGPVLEMKKIN